MDHHDANQLMNGMTQKQLALAQKNEEYGHLAEDMAQKERAYRMAKRGKIVELRGEGVPVTVIPDLVKGDKHVSQLRLEFIVAKEVLKSCNNAIKMLFSAIDTYRSMLSYVKGVTPQ